MTPVQMRMQQHELASAQLMAGSPINFQEAEAEAEAAGEAISTFFTTAPVSPQEREAELPAEASGAIPLTAAAFLRWAASEEQQEARTQLLEAARSCYEVHAASPYDSATPRSVFVLSRLTQDGASAELFTMRTRAENRYAPMGACWVHTFPAVESPVSRLRQTGGGAQRAGVRIGCAAQAAGGRCGPAYRRQRHARRCADVRGRRRGAPVRPKKIKDFPSQLGHLLPQRVQQLQRRGVGRRMLTRWGWGGQVCGGAGSGGDVRRGGHRDGGLFAVVSSDHRFLRTRRALQVRPKHVALSALPDSDLKR
jgi:hypothetical protein